MASWDVKTANSSLEFDTQNCLYNSCYQIDTNHFINFWSGVDGDGFSQVFTVNTSTWAVTTANSTLEFDTQEDSYNSCYKIDANHFINFWRGASGDGFTQVFTVNTSTWAITTANSALEFDTQSDTWNSCYKIDANHFINFWRGGASSAEGFVQIFTVNTTTWAVTTAGSSLRFEANSGENNSCYQIDDNHFINSFRGGLSSHGYIQVFTVNTSTWAVTTANSVLDFDTAVLYSCDICKIDTNHFINYWSSTDYDGFVQTFTVNTSTWAVTTANSSLEFNTGSASYNNYDSCFQIDTNHFINFYKSTNNDGFVQVFTVNTSTWAVTTSAAKLEFDTQENMYNSCYQIDTNHFINFWSGVDGDGFVQVFTVEGASGPAKLKTLNTVAKSSIKTINTNTIANTKTYNTIT